MSLRKILGLLLVATIASGLHVFLSDRVWEQRGEVRRNIETGYVFPSRFTRILALGHKGLYADYLFLNTITFFGGKQMYQEKLTDEDWDYLAAGLEAVTDLDPYFLDPYVLAEGIMTWENMRFEDANHLLEKGTKYRTWDWRMPYYLGFNYFYFLKDYAKGSEYLMEASRRPGSPSFLPKLAARLSYYGDQAKTGVLFLTGVLAQTADENLRESLLKRKTALEGAASLEEGMERFKKEQGRSPRNIEELLEKGYIDKLPEEPYGGKWIILQSGRVFSTSKFADPLKKKKTEKKNPGGKP